MGCVAIYQKHDHYRKGGEASGQSGIRRIGDFLKELHLTEGRNTGFKKILDALEANGLPKPEFETDEAHSYFISRFFIHKGFVEYANKKRSRKGAERKQNSVMTQIQLAERLLPRSGVKNTGIKNQGGSVHGSAHY